MSKPSKELQNKWYAIIADPANGGFEDIESPEHNLKKWHGHRSDPSQNGGKTTDELAEINNQKQDYYRAAGHFLHDYKFTKAIDHLTWYYHSEGKSVRQIAEIYKELGIPELKHVSVSSLINRLRSEMFKFYGTASNQ